MSHRLSLLFWCGVFIAVLGLYFLLTNLLSALPFASGLWYSFVPYAPLSGVFVIVICLVWYVVMVGLGAVLVFAGANIAKKGLNYEYPITSPTKLTSSDTTRPRKRPRFFWYGLFTTIFGIFLTASNAFEIIRQYIGYAYFTEHGLAMSQVHEASIILAINSAVFNLTLACVLVTVGVYVLKQRRNRENVGSSR